MPTGCVSVRFGKARSTPSVGTVGGGGKLMIVARLAPEAEDGSAFVRQTQTDKAK